MRKTKFQSALLSKLTWALSGALALALSGCNTADVVLGLKADKICNSVVDGEFSSNYDLAIASLAALGNMDKEQARVALDKAIDKMHEPYCLSYNEFWQSFYIAGLSSDKLKKGYNLTRDELDVIRDKDFSELKSLEIMQGAGYRVFYDGLELNTKNFTPVLDPDLHISLEITKTVPVLTTLKFKLCDSHGIERELEIEYLLHNPIKPTKHNIYRVVAKVSYDGGVHVEELSNLLTPGKPYGGCSFTKSAELPKGEYPDLPFPVLKAKTYPLIPSSQQKP